MLLNFELNSYVFLANQPLGRTAHACKSEHLQGLSTTIHVSLWIPY